MSILDTLTKSLLETYADKKSFQEKEELIKSLETLANHARYNKFISMFPDEGEFSRDKYKKHMDFIAAGCTFRERLLIAGNRVGKSELGAYELTCHATGNYPHWWTGRRFTRPVKAWIGGDTSTTVRDIIQQKLLGNIGDPGSGMLNKSLILDTRPKRNVPDAIETILVQHISGGVSSIVLKTYEQGRETWQGTEIDIIWLDEEPPLEIYSEALIRTMTTNGMVMLTFTPLRGLSDVVLSFMETDDQAKKSTSKCTITATWADAPHLTEQAKEELRASIPPNERDARENGNPVLGSGRIYPFQTESIVVTDFQIPKYYAKAYGMDVGWNKTAALWGALDRDNDILYIYSEHYAGESEPMFHAKAIKARGEWMKGVIDPASHGRSQIDGQALFNIYEKEGLKIRNAENAVEAGIYEVWVRMQTGRLKIFKSCTNLLKELALYHRNEKGAIVKKNDHLCLTGDTKVKTLDGFRYLRDLTHKDKIYTYSGEVVNSSNSFLIQKDVELVEVLGTRVTPDHCFLGLDGFWYPACISKGIKLLDRSDLWKLESSQTVSKNLTDKCTGNAEITFNAMELGFIEQYGNTIMEIYQKALKSIIKTLIGSTTKSKILNVSLKESTALSTQEDYMNLVLSKHLQKQLMMLPQFGMDLEKVKSGTNNITKIISTYYTQQLNVPVHTAERFTQLLESTAQHLFATIIANQHTGVVSKKTLKHALVVFVEKNLQLTNITKQSVVQEGIQNKQHILVDKIVKVPNDNVWCIYEYKTNSFVLENGLVSANCDCLRYLTLSGLRVASCQLETVPRKNNVVPWAAWG